MKRLRFVLLVAILLTATASAHVYDSSNLPYSDTPQDLQTAVAISALTGEGILEGNPDGTFGDRDFLNRAEYIKIVMGLLPPSNLRLTLNCFPDVSPTAWYAEPVCRAKALRIVRGNAIEGVPTDEWLFDPSRAVQYEEAMKVLVQLYNIPAQDTAGQWYERYIRAAESRALALPGLRPGDSLTRGEMARLTVAFFAFSRGELDALRIAQRGEVAPVEEEKYEPPSRRTPPPPPPPPTPPPLPPPPTTPLVYDSDSNVSLQQDFLLLGVTGPVLASANVFPDAEPLIVTKIKVVLLSAASSVDAFMIYDDSQAFVGKAYFDSGNTFTLNLKTQDFIIPKREEWSFYVRPVLKSFNGGGVSGQDIEISKLTIVGNGEWSHTEYTKSTSDSFSTYETARSAVVEISNGGDETAALVEGLDQPIGSFRFSGLKGDGAADLRVTDLTLQIEQAGGITLANVELSADGTSDRYACTVGTSTITCASIPAQFGTFEDGPRVITIFGDVTVPVGLLKGGLRLTLNDAGSVGSAGSVTWNDGTTNFSWVPGGNPVARSTYHSF